VADVAVDHRDRVYLLTRHDLGVLVYKQDGSFVKQWSHDLIRPGTHGISIGPDSSIWIVDYKEHFVAQFTNDGDLQRVIGTPGKGSDTGIDATLPDGFDMLETITHRGPPFNGPTQLAFAPDGDFFVSDGYRNAAIHHFSSNGDLLGSFGAPGTGPGQFRNPHSLAVSQDRHLYVADRENWRIQVFSEQGQLLMVIDDVYRPSGVALDSDGNLYVAEIEFTPGYHRTFAPIVADKFLPSRLSVFNNAGELIYRGLIPTEADQVGGANGIAVDSSGDVYIAEVVHAVYAHRMDVSTTCRPFHKLVRAT